MLALPIPTPAALPLPTAIDPCLPKVRVEHLVAGLSGKAPIQDISLAIPGKRVTALIGPAGCGKSTFLRCLNRLHDLAPGATLEGKVLLDGQDIRSESMDPEALRRRVGMIFQRPAPFPALSIRENVLAGWSMARLRPPMVEDLVEKSLRQAGLWEDVRDRMDHPPSVLDPGRQQRLCIARVLALAPEVILLDEPCTNLDPGATARVEELVHELGQDYTVIIATHSLQQAARVSHHTAFLHEGELVEFNDTVTLFTRPREPRTEDYLTGRFD